MSKHKHLSAVLAAAGLIAMTSSNKEKEVIPVETVPIEYPGTFRTRSGSIVVIETLAEKGAFPAKGRFSNGRVKTWHRSGKVSWGSVSDDDLIERLA